MAEVSKEFDYSLDKHRQLREEKEVVLISRPVLCREQASIVVSV